MKKKPSPTNRPRKIKRRPPRIPVNMRKAAEFWADTFDNVLGVLAHEVETPERGTFMVDVAFTMADYALHKYEERWPGIYL